MLAAAYVIAVGLLPARALAGSWTVAVPLAGAVSGLLATLAAMLSVAFGTGLVSPLLAVLTVSWVVALVALSADPGAPTLPRAVADRRSVPLAQPGLGHLGIVMAASAPVLAGSLAAPTEWDARAIWFFRAAWLVDGGTAAQEAMANPALTYAHPEYPPLSSSTIAGMWSAIGAGDLQLAQAVVTVQTWLAVVLAAVLVLHVVRARAQLAGALVGSVFVVACFGVAGGFGVRGYADLLWAGFALGGAIAALVLPRRSDVVRVAALCFTAAMLTKSDGAVVVGAVLLPLTVLRWLLTDRVRALPSVGLLALAVAAALAWPMLVGRFVAERFDHVTASSLGALLGGDAAKVDRVEPTLRSLWGSSRITVALAGAAIVAGLAGFAALRRRRRLGGGLWLPAAAAGAFVVFAVVFAAGTLEVHWWLDVAGLRTMTVVRGLLLTEVAVVAALAVDQLWGGAPEESSGAGALGGESAIDLREGTPTAGDRDDRPTAPTPAR